MIHEKLNLCAELIRKFNLGEKDYLQRLFPNQPKEVIDKAWRNGFESIKHRDIVRNSRNLRQDDIEEVNKKVKSIGNKKENIYGYIYSKFDVNQLKLKEEKIERRVRNELAKKYISIIKSEITPKESIGINTDLDKDKQNPAITKHESKAKKPTFLKWIYNKWKPGLIILSIGLVLVSPRIIDGLTPADKLAKEIYEDSSYKVRIGAKCRDGWNSRAIGRGACSHHCGVREWIYKKKYRKSYSECKREALEKSWID